MTTDPTVQVAAALHDPSRQQEFERENRGRRPKSRVTFTVVRDSRAVFKRGDRTLRVRFPVVLGLTDSSHDPRDMRQKEEGDRRRKAVKLKPNWAGAILKADGNLRSLLATSWHARSRAAECG